MRGLTRWILTACLTGLLALPAHVSAQEDGMTRVREVFPADAADRIARIVSEAEAEGLPADPVLDKALEGAAKGVPAGRVVAAVSSYAERLRGASRLLGDRPAPDALVAGADALQRGATPEAVGTVAERAGDATPAALVVLGDLVDAGVPVEYALDVVTAALDEGRRGQDLLAMSAVVRRLLRQGTPPGLAARAVARTLAGEAPPSGVPPVQLPPQAAGPPVPPGSGPPGQPGPPDEGGPPGGGSPGGGQPGGGGGSGG